MMSIYSIITEKNCEELCAKELKDRFKVKSELKKGFVEFSANNETALKVAYFSQSAKRILFKIGSGSFTDLEDLIQKIKGNLVEEKGWSSLLSEKYRVTCSRQGTHDFNSVIVEQEVSETIKKEINDKKIKNEKIIGEEVIADYNTKELIFFVFIEDNNYLFGIDYAGKDLSKRHYLYFNNPNAVKGTTAFNLLLFADYKPGKVLLDCFSLAGVIPIEAALYEKGVSINFYSKEFFFPKKLKEINEKLIQELDKETREEKYNNIVSSDPSFPNLASQKKNARIAGVEREIAFSRTDTRDLDIKNFSKEIDMVCSRVIEPSKKLPEKKIQNTYENFFSSTKEFLKKGGTINFIIRDPFLLEETAEKHGFKTTKKLETSQGQQELYFIQLKRQK